MYSLLKKIFFLLDPESAHAVVKLFEGQLRLIRPLTRVNSKRLKASIGSRAMPHPIGLAAGFDKNAEILDLVEAMGFSFAEVGSITSAAYGGNPKPRIFRLPKDESMINRMGLPNHGAAKIASMLATYDGGMVLGGNIAKSPNASSSSYVVGIDDYLGSFKKIQSKVDYVTVNLSCPNTSDGKTFEDPALFADLIREIAGVREGKRPLLVKLSPDTETGALKKIVDLSLKSGVDGFVLGNTSQTRAGLVTAQKEITNIGRGGLSGKAIRRVSNRLIENVYAITGNDAIIMGAGGIMSPDDAIEKILLGASHVQIYTGLIYNGPFFVKQTAKRLDRFCRKQKLESYLEARGRSELVNSLKE